MRNEGFMMASPMHNHSTYLAILGLSSNSCVSGIMHDGQSDGLDINFRSTCPSIFSCPMCGVPEVDGDEGWQRRTHRRMISERHGMDAIVPLAYW